MATFNYNRARRTVDRQIKRFGGTVGGETLLVRDGATRPCRAARLEYSPEEKKLFLEGASRILISALSVTEAPNFELDMIYFAGALYRIVEPIKGPRQGTDTILYYDCSVVFVQDGLP